MAAAPYCTLADLLDQVPERELIQLTDDEDTGELQQGYVDAAIRDATDIINGYVRGRYGTFPADQVPGLIRTLCVDIALYELYKRRLGHRMDRNDPWYIRYQDALAMLKDIQKGVLVLDAPLLVGDSGQSGDFRISRTLDRVFGRDVLERMP